MPAVEELARQTADRVDEACLTPEGRLACGRQFYSSLGRGGDFGCTEVNFIQWSIDRGAFDRQSGSAWWRVVNREHLLSSQLAAVCFDAGVPPPNPVAAGWYRFFRKPEPVAWHRAHARSIVAAYLAHAGEARGESEDERLLIGVVLARLLAAHGLSGGAVLGPMGRLLVHPRFPVLGSLVSRADLYPRSYPPTAAEAERLRLCFSRRSSRAQRRRASLFDQAVSDRLPAIFAHAARDLGVPELKGFARNRQIVYPFGPSCGPWHRTSSPRKVAILGGGLGGLSAAYELTEEPGWQRRYEITVYQFGWRLGGKMSGGRGADERIEELGLHLLLGFYHRAFRLFRQVYRERRRRDLAPDCPYQRLDDALVPNNTLLFVEPVPGDPGWVNWPISVPERAGRPGDDRSSSSDPLRVLPALVLELLRSVPEDAGAARRVVSSRLNALVSVVEKLAKNPRKGPLASPRRLALVLPLLVAARSGASALLAAVGEGHHGARRLDFVLDFATAVVRGMLRDVIGPDGQLEYEQINELDFRAWLASHGARPRTLDSVLVRFFYNASFNNLPTPTSPGGQLAAGTALQFLLMGASYRGSIFYQLRLGTADTLIMPLYQVLEARGVRFEFFHRATSLQTDGAGIGKIELERQARLRDPDKSYDPVQWTSGGVPAWPARPLLEQLEPTDGAAIAALEADQPLESPHTLWPCRERRVLERGVDFDEVVLGIPPAGLRDLCADLVANDADKARSGRWQRMLDTAGSVQVMSAQLWFRRDLGGLGFDRGSWGLPETQAAPNVVTYTLPVFSWLDQTHFTAEENRPANDQDRPRFVIAFTNSIGDDNDAPNLVRDLMRPWLDDNLGWFLPGSVCAGALDEDVLAVPSDQGRQAPYEAQFFYASHLPSDRYVLAPPGGGKHRLAPDNSGFDNLVLVGDWTDFGANFGYMEGTIISAQRATTALSSRCRASVNSV